MFIQIKTEDKVLGKLLEQVEKYCHMQLWISKAISLLNNYSATLDLLDTEKEPKRSGLLIEQAEAYFMSAVSFYLRCFLNQPSTHLKISDVVRNKSQQHVFDSLMTMRNDEFVHWKGHQSKLEVTYSFKHVSGNQCELARTINVAFNQCFGPGASSEPVLRLFELTARHVEDKRTAILGKIRERLQNKDVFMKSRLLNDRGESIIKEID